MAVTYGFYNSVNGDRKYNAEQMAQIFDGIINDGVFSSVGTAFKVSPSSGMVISVGAGRAWFNHTWTYNDAAITLTVSTAPAGTLSRIDAVVIEVDTNNRVNTIKIVAGTQAASPVRPTLTDSDGVYQYALAYITVAAGTTTITSAMIASVVGTDTPFVTGPLETVGVTALYDYWRAEFETWFDHLQDELDSNQAANLQHQIDDLGETVDAIHTWKVGDIRFTALDPSEDGGVYALCNGEGIDPRGDGGELYETLSGITYNGHIDVFRDTDSVNTGGGTEQFQTGKITANNTTYLIYKNTLWKCDSERYLYVIGFTPYSANYTAVTVGDIFTLVFLRYDPLFGVWIVLETIGTYTATSTSSYPASIFAPRLAFTNKFFYATFPSYNTNLDLSYSHDKGVVSTSSRRYTGTLYNTKAYGDYYDYSPAAVGDILSTYGSYNY